MQKSSRNTRLPNSDVQVGRRRHARRPIGHGLLFAALLLCGGCTHLNQWLHNGFKVGPDYGRPAAPVAEEWIDLNDSRVISESQGVDNSAWWTVFDDPAIDNLVGTSYAQNLPLRVAGLRVLEARAQRAIAAGLMFPQFQEAFAQYQRIQVGKSGNALGLAAVPLRAFDHWSTGFNLGWEVDVWGKFRRNLESADGNLDASIENYDDILVCLVADTAATYVEIRAFQQRIEYARANVVTQEGSLKIATSRFENGAVSELDVTQARSNLGQTQSLIPVLELGLRDANNRLCVLLGLPPRDLTLELGEGPIPQAPPQVVVGIPAELLRRRPDVREAERRVAIESAQIGVATADLFPAFTINGSLNWQASKFSQMFSSAANAGSIGPSFNWDILNYGRIVNNIRAQDARFQQLAVQYQQTVLSANAEVETAITSFLKTQEEVAALLFSVTATERSVELALTQYREGAIDFNRVFNLQSTLVEQQDQLAAAQANVVTSLIRVYKALGGGWQLRLADSQSTSEPQDESLLFPELGEDDMADTQNIGSRPT